MNIVIRFIRTVTNLSKPVYVAKPAINPTWQPDNATLVYVAALADQAAYFHKPFYVLE